MNVYERRKAARKTEEKQLTTKSKSITYPIEKNKKSKQSRSIISSNNIMNDSTTTTTTNPAMVMTFLYALIYIVSGSTQPLLMYMAKDVGIADPRCQLYMVAYYIGPACMGFTFLPSSSSFRISKSHVKAAGIACLDVMAQSINYTGAILAGPTIFSIVYSSVTVWTALQSRFVLGRWLSPLQWCSVFIVFGGLLLLKNSATDNGKDVMDGTILSVIGSAMHALTYVLSEAVMTTGEKLSVRVNCFIQGLVACSFFMVWQLLFTVRHFEEYIESPMKEAKATVNQALFILFLIAVANLIHALSFFHTLRHFPGGSTSAGVMKGLQATLVFVTTAVAFCGRRGGEEMCFSFNKFISLIVVSIGVSVYGFATSLNSRDKRRTSYETIGDGESYV